MRILTLELPEQPASRLDKALAEAVPEGEALSRSRVTKLLSEGAVSIGGQVVDMKAKPVALGLYEVAFVAATEIEAGPENIPLNIVYEDEALIVVNKPAGMVVHPAPGTPHGTLVNALLHHCADSLSGIGGEKRPGIVHRIDKDTSGLLVVAKSDAAHHGLARQFEKHSAHRRYLALAYGVPDGANPRLTGLPGVGFEPGNILRITTHLARHKTDRQRQAVTRTGGRHAVTRARVLQRFGRPEVLSLLECWLETGRTHQIRVHLSHVGHSLVGDSVYGRPKKLAKGALSDVALETVAKFPRQALHAAELGFEHPISGKSLKFEAALPDDVQEMLKKLL